jgi:benzoate-CoA ligase
VASIGELYYKGAIVNPWGDRITLSTLSNRRTYNAASDLIDRNLTAHPQRIAFIDDRGSYTYAELASRVDRFAGALAALGVRREQRVLLAMLDTIDFPTAFLGAIKFGAVPVPTNTLFPPADLAYLIDDSRACVIVASPELSANVRSAIELAGWRGTFVGEDPTMASLLRDAEPLRDPAPTHPDEPCFWLYSSGSTGPPKGAVHIQTSMIQTAELFAQGVLAMDASDVAFSAAKLFFAYGLGNSLSFPMSVGATTVLRAGRVTPDLVFSTLRESGATIFCGVPTLFGALLAQPGLPRRGEHKLRLCTSAGEALPEQLGRSWLEKTGVDVIDGIGSTEMLHIFVSNRPGEVRYGTTGTAVPGYRVRLVDENGTPVERGEVGDLEVSGPTAATCYWNQRERTRQTFCGEWTKTGDKFCEDADGYLVHCGRTDDMLKVGGIWVSPGEVESALLAHESVLECAVIGVADDAGLVKPKAFIVLKEGFAGSAAHAESLQQHVKARLAPYKYPRWIEFVGELPKTATGKIRRVALRELERVR